MKWLPPKLIAALLTYRGWNPRVIRTGSRLHEALLRRFGRSKLVGADTLLLTTRGRTSGREASTPLFYAREGGRLLIAASFAGSGTLPGWYLNLRADPQVKVTAAAETRPYRARTLSVSEAAEAWPKLVSVYPTFAKYRRRARREIPVVELRLTS